MTAVKENIQDIISSIRIMEEKCQRPRNSVHLLAVSKTKPVEAIVEAIESGQRMFGENYVQEGVDKVNYFLNNFPDTALEWHFIGPIQSNKSRLVAEHFAWVHTVDREKIARRLSEQRPDNMPPLQVLIQINTSGEESKSGTDEAQLFELAELISTLPNLTLRGLMSIPANVDDYASQLKAFKQLSILKEKLSAKYPDIDTLSMGMTGDMQAAIEAGSTIVRIGTAIFGARDYSNKQ
ncbi:YggS family pyridoxal phosphate-dependent enzyme [Vibrio viridaestus]|uniref:Pyridoxal phosphate homeostasis protein n=1 Tax=Vibrio viridaestus TaxID=2487322 RepID=A0A3N9TF45_9VIBR|nr:YggS family pyridoxal phosphate-dependent enzyme [Vibrio viridaestus]RQW62858.1 YggS family pyridoxal phosphate-dependent enzyme [Vibrio viridaestus]